jgi:hypothetical protein
MASSYRGNDNDFLNQLGSRNRRTVGADWFINLRAANGSLQRF